MTRSKARPPPRLLQVAVGGRRPPDNNLWSRLMSDTTVPLSPPSVSEVELAYKEVKRCVAAAADLYICSVWFASPRPPDILADARSAFEKLDDALEAMRNTPQNVKLWLTGDEPVVLDGWMDNSAWAIAEKLCFMAWDVPQSYHDAGWEAALDDTLEVNWTELGAKLDCEFHRALRRLTTTTSSTPAPVSRDVPPAPTKYLLNWRDILDALGLTNDEESRRLVRRLNEQHNGPIVTPGQGGQPRVNHHALVEWWNGLEALWRESEQRAADAKATTEEQYHYAADGEVVPGISGHIKKARSPKSDR
jgi:hypothetical protein